MASVFKVHEAKTNLSKLIEQALAGGDVVIARGNIPAVRLVPIQGQPERVFGAMRGHFGFDETFFDPLPPEELDAWEGR